jgi:hypothetical protein
LKGLLDVAIVLVDLIHCGILSSASKLRGANALTDSPSEKLPRVYSVSILTEVFQLNFLPNIITFSFPIFFGRVSSNYISSSGFEYDEHNHQVRVPRETALKHYLSSKLLAAVLDVLIPSCVMAKADFQRVSVLSAVIYIVMELVG